VAVSFAPEFENGRDKLSERLRGIIEHGQQVRGVDYIRALARIPLLNCALDEIFSRYDAILTPAAPGEAPVGLDTTATRCSAPHRTPQLRSACRLSAEIAPAFGDDIELGAIDLHDGSEPRAGLHFASASLACGGLERQICGGWGRTLGKMLPRKSGKTP
jgi:hypothetical protein